VTYTFPTVTAKQTGYDHNQVDTFVELARVQFSDSALELVTANLIRNTEFDLVAGGYQVKAVDTAMDRLEDAFAAREVQRQKLFRGDFAVDDRLARIVEIVQARVSRPRRKKFSNVGWLLRGYDRKQVDKLCAAIEQHLSSKTPLQINVVRRSIFSAKRGGYVESQVDAFIDRVVEILQIEKNR
jgi:DivIVA domain-containing protein